MRRIRLLCEKHRARADSHRRTLCHGRRSGAPLEEHEELAEKADYAAALPAIADAIPFVARRLPRQEAAMG